MNSFNLNRKIRREYNRLYRQNPLFANLLLLFAELADEKGDVGFETHSPESEIQRLMVARFDDPLAYQLSGGPKR